MFFSSSAACASLWLLMLFHQVRTISGLASSSSNSKVRKGGGGGFGAASSSASKSTDLIPDTSSEIQTLLQFLESQKAEIANVAVGIHPEHGRGLYATKNFVKKQGEQIICKIPSDCALALADPAQKTTLTVAQEGANLLEMYLKDAARRPQFAPYLDTLPVEITDPTPDLFTADELALLEFPRIINKAKERKQDIAKVAQERGLSLSELQYATWLVTSRSYPLALSPDEETLAEFDDRGQVIAKADANRAYIRVLIPLLDLVNHSSNQPNARLTILDPQKDNAWFALETLRPIAAGTEIRMAYGSGVDSSVELLLNYGLVPRANRVDAFMLQKGGDDCLAAITDWSTTLEQDETMLEMTQAESQPDAATETLAKILQFRIQLKRAYSSEKS